MVFFSAAMFNGHNCRGMKDTLYVCTIYAIRIFERRMPSPDTVDGSRGVLKYKCSQSDLQFERPFDLQEHKGTHTGRKRTQVKKDTGVPPAT
jgi:hypothetical protein